MVSRHGALCGILAAVLWASAPLSAVETVSSQQVFDWAGQRKGLCIHLGCGRDGSAGLTAELASRTCMLLHGLALDDAAVVRARGAIEARSLVGRAMVEKMPAPPLPYLDNLANMVVIEDMGALKKAGVTSDDIRRITAPGGSICILEAGKWTRQVVPRPAEMDEWTHPAHGADNNWVSADLIAGFPAGLRWQDGVPMNFNLWAACRAFVTAGGRCFTLSTTEVENLGPTLHDSKRQDEYLTARDAFNGLPLWKVNCETVNDGKALNHRNTAALVSDGWGVYVYKKDRVVALDAATGRVEVEFRVKHPVVRMLLVRDVLVCAGWKDMEARGLWDPWIIKSGEGAVEAFDAATGKPRWSHPWAAQHMLSADANVYLLLQAAAPPPPPKPAKGQPVKPEPAPAPKAWQRIVAVDLVSGQERWRLEHEQVATTPDLQLVVAGHGILSVASAKDKAVSILAAESGKTLWQIKPAGSLWTPLVQGVLWNGTRRYDPRTGESRGNLPAWVNSGGCTPSCIVGNGRYATASRGCGYTDLKPDVKSRSIRYAAVRGGCLEGAVPANGMFYTAQNFCRCAPGQVSGFVAFGPAGEPLAVSDFEGTRPIEHGPAKAEIGGADLSGWTTFLGDAARSSFAKGKLPEVLYASPAVAVSEPPPGPLADAWRARLTACISSPVVAGGQIVLAVPDAGRVVALDAATGTQAWTFQAGSRVDGPPTLYRGLCVFGCRDGWVYALRRGDGRLVWRTRAAPAERRMVAFGQVESVWPACGSIMARGGLLYVTAGRTTESDGGLAMLALEPGSGEPRWARQIPPGPARVNDIPAWRDGRIAVNNMQFDPADGIAVKADAKIKPARQPGLEGLIDGTWIRLGMRRSGAQAYGVTTAEMLAWNDSTLFAYDAQSRSCYAMAAQTARTTTRPAREDFIWRTGLGQGQTASAMALCENVLLIGGARAVAEANKSAGFVLLISPRDGRKLAELPLAAAPVYQGIAIADGAAYVAMENGKLVWLTGR